MEIASPGPGILFENHYSNLFKNRWEKLYSSLKKPVKNIALIPPFYTDIPPQNDQNDLENFRGDHSQIPDDEPAYQPTVLPWCYEIELYGSLKPKERSNVLYNKNIFDANGLVSRLNDYVYYLDGASAFAAFCLDARPGERVLDMCSSPGGKTIILVSTMFHEQKFNLSGIPNGSNLSTTELVEALKNKMNTATKNVESLLVCNEPNQSRYKRMLETVKRFIPDKLISGMHIQFVNYDATLPNKFQRFGKFDKILIDAPCSSERHLISKNLPWSYKNVKENSKRQLKLLQTAISLLKTGGTVVYCTCALDPMENELIINTILKAYEDVKHVNIDYDDVLFRHQHFCNKECQGHDKYKPEKRTYGCSLMPDLSEFGPLYIAKLQKQ
ncbi:hypothetical protein MACK_003340 [Theileria orientalis]|uniref:NOL1/NOP2/Sun domain family member 4 n=1 Tax=Theileria orientalis TaxID=68886 RepID=A0A976SIJ1_THEOR|nr:hypothetical protein MACK_003340 [Theileria orientalis]